MSFDCNWSIMFRVLVFPFKQKVIEQIVWQMIEFLWWFWSYGLILISFAFLMIINVCSKYCRNEYFIINQIHHNTGSKCSEYLSGVQIILFHQYRFYFEEEGLPANDSFNGLKTFYLHERFLLFICQHFLWKNLD